MQFCFLLKKPNVTIQQQVQQVTDKLLLLDTLLSVIPWKAATDHTHNEPIPFDTISTKVLETRQRYFRQINLKPTPTNTSIWVDFQMVHTTKWTLLKDNLGPWLLRSQMGLYPQKLQSEQ
jgi:hypothetical protein